MAKVFLGLKKPSPFSSAQFPKNSKIVSKSGLHPQQPKISNGGVLRSSLMSKNTTTFQGNYCSNFLSFFTRTFFSVQEDLLSEKGHIVDKNERDLLLTPQAISEVKQFLHHLKKVDPDAAVFFESLADSLHKPMAITNASSHYFELVEKGYGNNINVQNCWLWCHRREDLARKFFESIKHPNHTTYKIMGLLSLHWKKKKNATLILESILKSEKIDNEIFRIVLRSCIIHEQYEIGKKMFDMCPESLRTWGIIHDMMELHFLCGSEEDFNNYVDDFLPGYIRLLSFKTADELASKANAAISFLLPRVIRLTASKSTPDRVRQIIARTIKKAPAYPAFHKQILKTFYRLELMDDLEKHIDFLKEVGIDKHTKLFPIICSFYFTTKKDDKLEEILNEFDKANHPGLFRFLIQAIETYALNEDLVRTKHFLSRWLLKTGSVLRNDWEVKVLFSKHGLSVDEFQQSVLKQKVENKQ